MLQFWLHIPRSSWRLLPRRSARHDHIGLATTESGWLNLISTLGFAPSDLAVPNIRAQWQLELRTVPTVEASYGHRALPPKRPGKRIHLFALYCPPPRVHSNRAGGPWLQNAQVIGPKLITDICWPCLFPIRIAGVPIPGAGGRIPEEAVKSPLCTCRDGAGLPRPGVTTSMREPGRLVEFQRVPGCSSVLNGTRFPFNRTFRGHHGQAAWTAATAPLCTTTSMPFRCSRCWNCSFGPTAIPMATWI